MDIIIPPLLVWLGAAVFIQRAERKYGKEMWRNPGGWRFPKGEIAALKGAVLGILLTVVVGLL